MSVVTRQEVLANRQKIITFLMQPKRKKAKKQLDLGGGNRCCLGHMCYVLKAKRTTNNTGISYGEQAVSSHAPTEVVISLGLNSAYGQVKARSAGKTGSIVYKDRRYSSLAGLNDTTDVTPQEVGKYLLSVIEGGPNTPWHALDTYPTT